MRKCVNALPRCQVPGDRYMAPTNSRKGGAMYLSPGTLSPGT